MESFKTFKNADLSRKSDDYRDVGDGMTEDVTKYLLPREYPLKNSKFYELAIFKERSERSG